MKDRSCCTICGIFKTTDNTYYKNSTLDQLDTYCKKCKNDQINSRRANRSIEQVEKDLLRKRNYNKTYIKKNVKTVPLSASARILKNIKDRARRTGIPFNLTEEDIVIPERCPLLDIPMEFGTMSAPSVDKIIPKLGYIKGNIVIVSKRANMMKLDASLIELMTFCKNATAFYSQYHSDE